MDDLISRQAAIDAICTEGTRLERNGTVAMAEIKQWCVDILEALPSAQPERDTQKRVLWTGWKGHRYTRYNCPNCRKPVRNDDVYCHRCGQRLMFPHISFTDYVPGEKQDVIVRWDDE